jgi:hypothetical protein
MGTILIHAGMPKAGSSAIQQWLAANPRRLRREHDITLAVAGGADAVRVAEFDRKGSINSDALALASRRGTDAHSKALARFFAGLEVLAGRHARVLLTSESFYDPLWRPTEDFLRGLEGLAERHEVRVACYVRPQHSAMEAAWCQWGFRYDLPPSVFLKLRMRQLGYRRMLRRFHELAPHVQLLLRPFRSDLLENGDVVADFARYGLEMDNVPEAGPRINPGLPLQVVILLRNAPMGRFWSSAHDNFALRQIKSVFADVEVPESEQVRRSRSILQAICHERFEPGNRELIRDFGWATGKFVPAPDEPVEGDLEDFDELWSASASEPELEILFHAIDRALDVGRRGRRTGI